MFEFVMGVDGFICLRKP